MDKGGLFVEEIKKEALGNWKSISVEVRPSSFKKEDGVLKPFYLTRKFSYLPEDKFHLEIINYADAFGETPLVQILIKGEVEWQGDHPILEGAQKVDFIANEGYEVTPLIQNFADLFNTLVKEGFEPWEIRKSQHVFKKNFALFGLKEGAFFKEYNLIYLYKDMMFWGARNVDGTGFDTEENRPTNLQIPMIRK